jgi:NADH-quinone oxidoreductase subunit J
MAAAALFVVVGAVTIGAEFPAPQGFPEGANITASIGYAMFDIAIDRISGQTLVGAESFLVAFIVVAILLDAALDGAVMLAKRDGDSSFGAVLADGGREVRRAMDTAAGEDGASDTGAGTGTGTDVDADADTGGGDA